jgi:hypothetical protein
MSVIPPCEVEFVERAANYLENPSFLVRVADIVGMPLEGVLHLAPARVTEAVDVALRRALDFAVITLPGPTKPIDDFPSLEQRAWWTGYRHSAVTALTGGTAGLFGTLGLCVELPVTTCVMLRSISAIARECGEDTREIDVRLECLSLFAFGGPSTADDDMDASYLAVRASLNSLVKQASKFVSHTPAEEVMRSIKSGTAPALVKLLGKISSRFELAVSEKLLAQAVPFFGALGGATINVLFAEHFNAVARYHFGLRHLGRRWGEDTVGAIYQEAAAQTRSGPALPESQASGFSYRGQDTFAAEASKPR